MGCRDVANMKWRVLPHQHDIDVGPEVDPLGLAKAVMRTIDPSQIVNWMRPGSQPVTGIEGERTDVIMPDSITARLRCQHQCKA